MSNIVKTLRTDKEKVYGLLALVLGALLWPLFVLGALAGMANSDTAPIVGAYVFYGVVIWIFLFVSSLVYRATAFGNMILLGPDQFPELHAMVVEGARELGMAKAPHAFLYNSNGLVNAFARRLFGGRYVFLTSGLVEATSDEQVRFIIGHELGHHAAGHLNPWLNFIKLPSYVVPFLQPAYSRAREFTCDSIGAHLSNDRAVSSSSLLMLGCGCRRLNWAMNCEAFLAQEKLVPPVWGFITEVFRSHPRLTRRIAALQARRALN
jgi:Zn-dependent protease with chaperone function